MFRPCNSHSAQRGDHNLTITTKLLGIIYSVWKDKLSSFKVLFLGPKWLNDLCNKLGPDQL